MPTGLANRAASDLAEQTATWRNSLIGPGLKDMDADLFRDINFERGVVLQFRAEITNVMNWVNLGTPTSSLSSGNDGKITGATATQRVIQLGGRLSF